MAVHIENIICSTRETQIFILKHIIVLIEIEELYFWGFHQSLVDLSKIIKLQMMHKTINGGKLNTN